MMDWLVVGKAERKKIVPDRVGAAKVDGESRRSR